MKRDSGCTLTYLRGEGSFAFRFPAGEAGMQEWRFTELEFLRGGIAERARIGGGRLGSAAAEAMAGALMPLSALRKAEGLSKKRRGAAGSRPHPRCVRLLRKLGPGERKARGPGRERREVPPERRAKGEAIMAEAVVRGAEECSYAPYRRYLLGWRMANGRGDEPKRLLAEFCGKVDARQGKKV